MIIEIMGDYYHNIWIIEIIIIIIEIIMDDYWDYYGWLLRLLWMVIIITNI